jgi:hypothetical protein
MDQSIAWYLLQRKDLRQGCSRFVIEHMYPKLKKSKEKRMLLSCQKGLMKKNYHGGVSINEHLLFIHICTGNK